MWHEARKQERKIRGMLVDYRKRAERRRDFYEKIRADPTQFLQLHGRQYKIHLDPNVAAAADSPAAMMPWQGQSDNLIDRFDVRAHLDYIPPLTKIDDEEITYEERQLNYERYRIIAQNSFLGISEEKFLKQLHLEEQFGYTENEKNKNKKVGVGAAIGFNYEDGIPLPPTTSQLTNSSDEQSDSDLDVDLAINVSKMDSTQAHEMNRHGRNFGMSSNDFYSFLTNDMEEAENFRLAKEEEHEKALFSGRKSRRERRAHREKRLANRVLSPPSYAARTSPTHPILRLSKSPSKSPSPENTGKITYITSFGDEDEPSSSTTKPTYADKVKYGKPKKSGETNKEHRIVYFDVNAGNNHERHKKRPRFDSTSSSDSSRRQRSRRRYRSRSRSRSKKKYRRRSSTSATSSTLSSSSSSTSTSRSRERSRRRRRSRYRSSRKRSYSSWNSSSGGSSRSWRRGGRLSSRSLSRGSSRGCRSESPSDSPPADARSRSRTPPPPSAGKRDSPPPPPKVTTTRYYGRRRSDQSSSDSSEPDEDVVAAKDDGEDDSQVPNTSNKSGSNSGTSTKKLPINLSLQERLKRKRQALLNKQFKADKIAEQLKTEREKQEQQNREDELREMAIKLRRRQRERRHAYDSNSSSSSDSETNVTSPIPTVEYRRSKSPSPNVRDDRDRKSRDSRENRKYSNDSKRERERDSGGSRRSPKSRYETDSKSDKGYRKREDYLDSKRDNYKGKDYGRSLVDY